MIPFTTLSLLGLSSASHLDIVSIPAYRKALQLNVPDTFSHSLNYNDTWLAGGWFIELEVGEPPQPLEVLIDTGSSDLWFPAIQAKKCREHLCVGGACEFSHRRWRCLRTSPSHNGDNNPMTEVLWLT